MAERLCSIEGCGKKHYGKGWCRPHCDAARHAASHAAHGEREHERDVAWRSANREKIRASGAAYRAAHPDKVASRNARRVWAGNTYVGIAGSLEQADQVKAVVAERFASFRAKQIREYREARDNGWEHQAVA